MINGNRLAAVYRAPGSTGLPGKVVIVAAFMVAAAAVMGRGDDGQVTSAGGERTTRPVAGQVPDANEKLPRIVDVGARKCIPCKMMAPILEELKKEYAGRLEVLFVDVWENPKAGEPYRIRMIPTQVFFDAAGKELFRHEGFFSKEDILGKWKQLGVDLTGKPAGTVERAAPAGADRRSNDPVCFMCDGDVNSRTRVVVRGRAEHIVLCSPHCFFIYDSSLKEPAKAEANASVTDMVSGNLIPATTAIYLCGLDANGRPTIMAFADKDAATRQQQKGAGNVLNWEGLRNKELATRCGFCDRAVYPEDACTVKVAESAHTYGCCVMCGLGVAARLHKDIEMEAKDALSGKTIRVQTLNGSVASMEPRTAVAWAGGKKGADGKWASTGCFKQAFFVNEANLKTWLEKHPTATGRMITIGQALAVKMKMTPQQIAGACKIGECK